MEYLKFILLYLIKKINGSRTIFGAYHILKGKKTAQTLQDCRLFAVQNLFGVYKQLERSSVVEIITFLSENNYIKTCGENRYLLTAIGESFLEKKMREQPLPVHLNGFQYKDVADIFWTRLALLTQCLSYLKINNSNFVPVVKDGRTQLWVKKKLTTSDSSIDLANKLYSELEAILQQFASLEASIFVLRLSGAHRFGFTIDQVAEQVQIDPSYAKILFTSVIHGMIKKAKENKEVFSGVFSLLDKIDSTNLLTETTQKTYSLLLKGLGIEEISRARLLKINTIEDHIVEIALNCNDFSIEPFVSRETQQLITEVVRNKKTKRLKEIKDKLDESITYFEIRLTLAKKGF